MWHTTAVKLHLEYLGELERIPKVTPHRVRLAAAKHAAPVAAVKTGSVRGKASRGDKELALLEAEAIAAAPRSMKSEVNSPADMHRRMRDNLAERTGRSMADWIKAIKAAGLSDWREAELWLKKEHGLSTMYAYMVAGAALEGPRGIDYSDSDGLLNSLYKDERAKLRPVYEKIREFGLKLGPEVQEVVCKTYTSLRSRSQFAVIAPTTRDLLDLALALPPDTQPTVRLEECRAMGGGERNKHRFRLRSVKDFDPEVRAWLKTAYDWDTKRRGK
jgi:hypothetical protein